MSVRQLLAWLGVEHAREAQESTPLRELIETLDRLEPARARHLARFAYLLGRVAHADEGLTYGCVAAAQGIAFNFESFTH